MQYINNMTVSAAIVSAAVLFGVFAVAMQPAQADVSKLKGTYAVTGSGGCVQGGPGVIFNPDFTLNGGGVALGQTVQATFTFNDDGTGTRSGISYNTVEPPSSVAGASVSDFSGPFTYTLGSDGAIEFMSSGPTTGTVLQGARTGQTFSNTGGIKLTGHVSKDKKTIVLATTEANVETVSFSNGDTFERVCNRSRVLTEI